MFLIIQALLFCLCIFMSILTLDVLIAQYLTQNGEYTDVEERILCTSITSILWGLHYYLNHI